VPIVHLSNHIGTGAVEIEDGIGRLTRSLPGTGDAVTNKGEDTPHVPPSPGTRDSPILVVLLALRRIDGATLLLAVVAVGAALVLGAPSVLTPILGGSLAVLLVLGARISAPRGSHAQPVGEAVLRGIPDLILRVGRDGVCLGSVGGRNILPSRHPAAFIEEVSQSALAHLERAFATGTIQTFESRVQVRGDLHHYEVRIVPNGVHEALLIVREIAGWTGSGGRGESRPVSQACEAIIGSSPLAIYATDLQGRVQSWNRAAERIFGWTEQEALNERVPSLISDGLDALHLRQDPHSDGALAGVEARSLRKDGTTADLSVWRTPLRDASEAIDGFITIAADIGERKSLERQLHQAQRMEAVGRLAGGVAHDFNNLLTVITGYAYMLLEDLSSEPGPRDKVEEILRAVERSSALTGQLLAFSRRQVAPPKTIDINELVLNMDKMLRRMIGEDIRLVTALSPDAGKIKADPGQIEQVIMNLVVNSRDAMPGGGGITVETANATLGDEYARAHLTARPGKYVTLSVIDTGHGMDEETRAHMFEPFFSTKEQGKGTGLGLAQVYGIIKQSGGDITVTSAPGRGTCVRIYLPRVFGALSTDKPERAEIARAGGTETVLLVEDEDDVRSLVCELLRQHGYTVLTAAQPQDAIEICQTHPVSIELLLTDVVMPQMSGRELAVRMAWIRPEMRVLYMSGYTEDAMPGASITEPGAAFLRKPFTPAALTRKIREVLEAGQGFGAT
jgi:PAS domain S-box-containing protein